MPEDHPATSTRPANLPLYAATTGLLAVFAVTAAAFLGAQYAIPIVILAALLLGFFALNDLTARRVLQRHDGDALAVQDDQTETTPTAHVIPDETALGDTAEAHAEISPHDVPKGSPIRKAVEHQARHILAAQRAATQTAQTAGPNSPTTMRHQAATKAAKTTTRPLPPEHDEHRHHPRPDQQFAHALTALELNDIVALSSVNLEPGEVLLKARVSPQPFPPRRDDPVRLPFTGVS